MMSRTGCGRWACVLLMVGLIGCHREAGRKELSTTDGVRSSAQTGDEHDASAEDAAALECRWEVMSSEFEGESATAVYRPGTLLVIEGDELYFTDGFAGSNPSRFSVDATTNPKSIDIGSGEGQPEVTKGIYSLDQDSLKLCMSLNGERPKQFKTTAGGHSNLFVLRRQ